MGSIASIPSHAGVVIVGAGFAGASTAAALARAGVGGGIVLEREPFPGTHSSGRNAAIARQVESEPELLALAIEGVRRLGLRTVEGRPVLNRTGALYVYQGDSRRAAAQVAQLRSLCVPAELLAAGEARRRFPCLDGFAFAHALFCPTDGVVDIHALLGSQLAEARTGGFQIVTGCEAQSLIVENGAVQGVRTERGGVRTSLVIDAGGAWAGRLGRERSPLPYKPLRRHLFVGGPADLLPKDAPVIWDLDFGYYVRPDGVAGLLLCPCDESEHPPGLPSIDPQAADLLADKLLEYAPGLAEVALQNNWACLRTFAPDRLPVIDWDADVSGLFHVSALGGFGMTTSLAVGELAATRIRGKDVNWIGAGAFSARRDALSTFAAEGV